MQYKELIQFEPITTVVKLVNAGEISVAENLVKTFVFSKKMQEDLREIIIKNLVTEPTYETKGIQIVGSYGYRKISPNVAGTRYYRKCKLGEASSK